MFFLGKKIRQAKQLIRQGELNLACDLARQPDFSGSSYGKRIQRRLIDQLVTRAQCSTVCGDLASAWRDLCDASTIAKGNCFDWISKEKNRLVDQTVGLAQSMLASGKPVRAGSLVRLLKERNIQDRRADEVQMICQFVAEAESLAATGRLKDALSKLQQAQQRRPDLPFLESRIRSFDFQKSVLTDLTRELQFAINQSAWSGAKAVSDRILQIAPRNQVALDAQKRCGVKQANAIHLIKDSQNVRTDDQDQRTDLLNESSLTLVDTQDIALNSEPQNMRSFMLWIDGVGGFLVCTNELLTIGRAVDQPGVDIPVQADLRRRHQKIKRVENQYLTTRFDQEDGWQLLVDQQILELENGVQAKFSMPNPLGCSARLEFVSRHRTQPWSDAVLLLGDALLLGPDRSHHVYCPRWKQKMVVFHRDGKVWLRTPGQAEVNGQVVSGDIELNDGVRVTGDEYSISCEGVSTV